MSRGPALAPTRCITLELKDLADTRDWEQDAIVGEFYGFQYTDEGYYKRVEVGEDRKVPKLEQLRNVLDKDIYNNFDYKLKRIENKWNLIPVIDWEIKFEFVSPYTYFDMNQNFRKSFNAGPLLVSLVPDETSRREIAIKPFMKRRYLLHRKNSVNKKSGTSVKFMPSLPFPNEYTMIFDIAVKASESSVSDVLMPGITISWRGLQTESFRILIVIQSDNKEIQTFVSDEKVNLSITPGSLKKIDFINITHLDLLAFYWTDQVLPDEYLQSYASHSTSITL